MGLGCTSIVLDTTNPRFQRFVSEDPLGLRGGVNLFAYAAANPVSFADPFGLKPPDPESTSCITSALGAGALDIGLDAIGLIPEGGGAKTVARDIGHWAGYRGVVADNFGKEVLEQVGDFKDGYDIGEGVAEQDWWSIGFTVAGFVPGLEQAVAIGSIIHDTYETAEAINQCP